jgi:transcriptional regulator with XRE-family HTH domain
MVDFSSNIKLLRIASGLTWREWAKKCGVSLSSAQRYELEEVKPSYDVLLRISKNLRIPVASLSGQEPLIIVPGPGPIEPKKRRAARA